MMGREKNSPTKPHSSIALLQERFKQLQRAKEMREERELIRDFADMGKTEAPKLFSHPDLVQPSRPPTGPQTHRREQPEFRALETSLSMDFASLQRSNICSDLDVDTSLHL